MEAEADAPVPKGYTVDNGWEAAWGKLGWLRSVGEK
jgi:hypothetical protein